VTWSERKRNAPLRKVDAENPDEKQIQEAAQLIRQGGIVAFPTESFYGLGVDPAMESAVERLFLVKRRHKDRPILLLIAAAGALDHLVSRITPAARRLMDAFWPGGLTLVFSASDRIPSAITAGTGKIGIRISSHPVAAALVRAVGGILTGTSANLSGMPPCRYAQEVLRQLGGQVDRILDGGITAGKDASTVLDVSEDPPRILRQGIVSREQLQSCIDLP
jgi:L-threonylcarbamoyladenylate synthase